MSDGSRVGFFLFFMYLFWFFFLLFIYFWGGLGVFLVCFTSLPLKLLSMLCSHHTKKAPDLHPSQEDRHHGPTRTQIHRASAEMNVKLGCGPHGPPSPGRQGGGIASFPLQRLLAFIVSVASALCVIFFLLLAFYSIMSAIIIACTITFWRMKKSGTTRCRGA